MHLSFRIARVVAHGLFAAIVIAGIAGGSDAVMRSLLVSFLFTASYLNFYAYAYPKRVADQYTNQSTLFAWLSGAIAYNTPAKAKAYGLFIGLLTLTVAVALLVGLLRTQAANNGIQIGGA